MHDDVRRGILDEVNERLPELIDTHLANIAGRHGKRWLGICQAIKLNAEEGSASIIEEQRSYRFSSRRPHT